MKSTFFFTAQALLGSAALLGCAAPGPQSPQVRPVFDVRHAMAPAEAYYELGRYHHGLGQWARAEDAYRKSIALRAGFWEAYNGLGAALAMQGRYDAAREAFEAALAIAPEVAVLQGNLRHLERLSGDAPPATAVLPAEPQATAATVEPALPATGRAPEMPGPVVIAATVTVPALEVVQAQGEVAATAPGVYVIADAAPVPAPVAGAPLAGVGTVPDAEPAVAVWRDVTLAAAWPSPAGPDIGPTARAEPPLGFRLEVANGNGVTGMARYVGRLLAVDGLPRARLANQKPFVVPHTRVEYRAGFEAQARAVSERLPGQPGIVAAPALRPVTDVRVVLGHNLPRTLDFALNARPVEVAAAATEALPDY